MVEKLKEEFNFFKKNREELVNKYNGLYVAIIGHEVVGQYKDIISAIKESKKYDKGTVFIQKVQPKSEDNPRIFHSRIILNH